MSTISIIGLGTYARAIGTRAIEGGHAVEVIGRDAAKTKDLADALGGGATAGTFGTAPAGDIVILAVPYASAVPVVAQYGDALAGKVVIDISNTFTAADDTELVTPDGSSGAEEIAKAVPASAHVVKAFNTVFAHVLALGRPLDVLFAGDDARAKVSVSAFIESLGLRPLDVGSLEMAHWLEGAALLMMGLAGHGAGFNIALGVDLSAERTRTRPFTPPAGGDPRTTICPPCHSPPADGMDPNHIQQRTFLSERTLTIENCGIHRKRTDRQSPRAARYRGRAPGGAQQFARSRNARGHGRGTGAAGVRGDERGGRGGR